MMMMMMLLLMLGPAVAVLPAHARSYPCRSSAGDPQAHHPGPQVCERAVTSGAETEMTRANAM